ncbi:hypothetical protein ACM9HF_20050 [Colwellia sp. RE-S-Sl-9]
MKQSLLIRYFELKKLPPDLRYQALQQWEKEAQFRVIQQQKNEVIELCLVSGSHR